MVFDDILTAVRKCFGSHVAYSLDSKTSPKVIKHFSCSAQLRLKFILLINVKMPTIIIDGILTFISRINYYRPWCYYKPSFSIYLGYFGSYEQFKLYAQLN